MPLEARQHVRDFEIGVAVARVGNLAALAEEAVRLVDLEDGAAAVEARRAAR